MRTRTAPSIRRHSAAPAGRLLVALLGVALLVGCPRRAPSPEEERLPLLLAGADRAWIARGTGGFEPVQALLDEAAEIAPDSPRVHWRKVRLEVGRGLAVAGTSEAIRHYSRARAQGLSCLEGDDEPVAADDLAAWERSLRRQPKSRLGCLDWTAFAWSRWLVAIGGDAGALDLDALDVLFGALPPGGLQGPSAAGVVDRREPWLRPWTEGLLFAARPASQGRDLERARAALEAAVEGDRTDLARRADLALLVARPARDAELWSQTVEAILTAEPDTPEDHRAVERIRPLAPLP